MDPGLEVLDVIDDGVELTITVESTVSVTGLRVVWHASAGEGSSVGQPARRTEREPGGARRVAQARLVVSGARDCEVNTWTEQSDLAAARRVLTARTGVWTTDRIEAIEDTHASIAKGFGVSWSTWAAVMRATQRAFQGDLSAADQLSRGALLRGEELEQNAGGVHLLQRFVLRFQQRRLAEEIPGLRHVAQASSVFRAGAALAALASSETGHIDQATTIARDTIGDDGTLLPRDVFWLAGMALLAEVATTARDHDLVPLIRDLIEPCASHVVVFGTGAAVLGTGHQWLGRLATAAGDHASALEHFDQARAIARRIGAPYWEAQATIDLARALADRARASDRRDIRRLTIEATSIARPNAYERILVIADRLR